MMILLKPEKELFEIETLESSASVIAPPFSAEFLLKMHSETVLLLEDRMKSPPPFLALFPEKYESETLRVELAFIYPAPPSSAVLSVSKMRVLEEAEKSRNTINH